MSNKACYHCTEPVFPHSTFTGIINQQEQLFCCPACLAIAETIHAGGLDNYYLQRSQKAPKLPQYDFSLWDSDALQSEFVKHHSDSTTLELYIEGLHCTSCAWLIEKHLLHQNDIVSANVNYQKQKLTITFKNSHSTISSVMSAIAAIGYLPHPWQTNNIQNLHEQERKKNLKQIGITAILMMQIGMFSIAIYAGDFLDISAEYRQLLSLFSLLFSIPLLYFSALPFFINAWIKIKHKQINIDVSVSIAIIGLYVSSVYSVLKQTGDFYFDSIAMFCLFILIARFIEKQSRASLFINQALLPSFALQLMNGLITTVASHHLSIGDIILLKAGEVAPIDGLVKEGSSTVSEAFLNGEPNPVRKNRGDEVFAGSINHDGELYLSVSNTLDQCYVKKIEALSQQAALNKPEEQNLTDKIATYFTKTVYTLAILTGIYWYLQGNDHAFWIALSVLVISCPCALSLAAPTALSTIQHTLRKAGILIQSPHTLDVLPKIDHVIFDKTGTLTYGKFSIIDFSNLSSMSENDCLQIATALEATSNHPIANAFQQHGLIAHNITTAPTKGVEGIINDVRYRLGNSEFCQEWLKNTVITNKQGQWIYLCTQEHLLGSFLLNDELRNNVTGVVKQLHNNNITTHILSGDPSSTVDAIAQQLHILNAKKSCSSLDKHHYIVALQQQGKHCLTIGDGINDAQVLAQSDISITLFDACDWVKNTTDVIFLNNQLSSLTTLFIQAKRYRLIVRQNLLWALLYNAVAIPFAMAGLVTPYLAALGMSLSSIAVVMNSRRLRKSL